MGGRRSCEALQAGGGCGPEVDEIILTNQGGQSAAWGHALMLSGSGGLAQVTWKQCPSPVLPTWDARTQWQETLVSGHPPFQGR